MSRKNLLAADERIDSFSVQEDARVTASILALYSDQRNGKAELDRRAHIRYSQKGLLQPLSEHYLCLDASQPWLCYWMLHSLELLDPAAITDDMRCSVLDTLGRCLKEAGFGGSQHQIAHLAPTYAASMSLCILEDYAMLERDAMYAFLRSTKQADGSFAMHDDGEVDLRACYCALSVAYLTNTLTPELAGGVKEYIMRCQSWEGGFGACEGAEAHGGYTYCGLAALCILRDAGHLPTDNELVRSIQRAVLFAKSLQCPYTGAFRGRTGKLVDACYSFWVGAIFPLARLLLGDVEAGFDGAALEMYLLAASQQGTGFADKPGKAADFYHTCYALSGLAVAQAEGPDHDADTLPAIDVRLNTLSAKVARMRRYFGAD